MESILENLYNNKPDTVNCVTETENIIRRKHDMLQSEIECSIRNLKTSSGNDDIYAELLTVLPPEKTQRIPILCNQIWKTAT